jgi:peptidoglycan/LPS O-acetylase OafA/YrhL
MRLEHIDGLRALAALYVVVHHMVFYMNDSLPAGRMQHIGQLFMFGHYAVDIFIVLSGFCLMLPVIRNEWQLAGGAWLFFKKRARRILPPYFSAVAFSLVLIFLCIGKSETIWKNSLPITWPGILAHLVLVQDIFNGTVFKINYVLWSISVEWRIYFLFPLLVLCWRRFGALKTVSITATLAFLAMIPLSHTPLNTSDSGISVHYIGLFSFGMLAAGIAYAHEGNLAGLREKLPWFIFAPVLFGAALALNKGYFHHYYGPWQIQDLLVGLGTLSLLVALTPREHSDVFGWLRAVLGCKPLAWVGMFSYSLYLVHPPVIEVLWKYLLAPLNLSPAKSLVAFSTVGLLATVAIAYGFFLICEKPFMKWPSRNRAQPGAGASVILSSAVAQPAAEVR